MNTLERIKLMARTANNGNQLILSDEIAEAIMPKIIEAINKQCKGIGYDGVTYNRPASEYPDVFYNLIYTTPIRQTVLDYLEEHHPMAWFKPMYFTPQQQIEFFKDK